MADTVHAVADEKAIVQWINGRRVVGNPCAWGNVYDPATGDVTAKVALASSEDADAAIDAAIAVFPTWANTPAPKRARVMFRFKALIEAHMDELADLITHEHGKVISDARGSLQRGLEVVEFACGIPHLLKGEYSEQVGTGVDSFSMRQPLGLCAGITPFNFPAMVPMWMFPVAIACGNTFILKPSEKDPSCSMRLAELLKQAGLPDGVFNVLNGDKRAVDAMLQDERIAAISFVGSTPVAQYIYTHAAQTGKRVQSLGGAKNHMVVLPDADIEQTADALMGAAYGSAGERCMAISVAIAVGDAGDRLRQALLPKIAALRVSAGRDPDAEMGPLITREHRDKVKSFIDAGIAEGAELVVDGRNITVDGSENGFFLGPTFFDHANASMRIYKEEIFGPVLTMLRVEDPGTAIDLVNTHEYGNGTAVFTRSGKAAREFASQVQVGMVGINVPIPVPAAYFSFGGWKRSVFGDSNMHGMDGVRFYTKLKTVTSRWPDDESDGANLNMPVMD